MDTKAIHEAFEENYEEKISFVLLLMKPILVPVFQKQ